MPNNQYGYYNISKSSNKEDLRQEFAWELYCFQLSLNKFITKYKVKEYPYPEEAPKTKILEDIKIWKEKMNDFKDKVLFDAMNNIILGKKTDIDFDSLFDEIDSNKKLNPKRLNEIIGPLNYALDQIVEDAKEKEKMGKAPSFHVGEKMEEKSTMYKIKNAGEKEEKQNIKKQNNKKKPPPKKNPGNKKNDEKKNDGKKDDEKQEDEKQDDEKQEDEKQKDEKHDDEMKTDEMNDDEMNTQNENSNNTTNKKKELKNIDNEKKEDKKDKMEIDDFK